VWPRGFPSGRATIKNVTSHSESRVVPFPADLMFAVVADVARYPEFLPWVAALRVLSQGDKGLVAEMLVSFGPFREKYTSGVTLDRTARAIDVTAIKGPFRHLQNQWRFTPEGSVAGQEVCRIDFSIAFEFRNPLLQAAASKAFEKALMKMTDAFVARAAAIKT
jgi:coenzyme Q-binding protein COQ10